MARIVDSLPKTNRGRVRKYDFEPLYKELLATGKAAELVAGEDYKCEAASIRQYLYKDTAERGLRAKVRTVVGEDGKESVIFSVEKAKPKDKTEKSDSK